MGNTTKLFKIGDVVKENKHSYKMTVEESNEKTTDCVYFDNNQNLHRVVYNTNELQKI
ncbi:hypothetical protein [Mesoflavibacter sp. CH_XMU1422-2]|uniref:hypothetical protein n=1 Tax=Mesoflavibacter sp. CH_XMU1422-2 TaxID=3107770 RepID=UPI00300B2CEC